MLYILCLDNNQNLFTLVTMEMWAVFIVSILLHCLAKLVRVFFLAWGEGDMDDYSVVVQLVLWHA